MEALGIPRNFPSNPSQTEIRRRRTRTRAAFFFFSGTAGLGVRHQHCSKTSTTPASPRPLVQKLCKNCMLFIVVEIAKHHSASMPLSACERPSHQFEASVCWQHSNKRHQLDTTGPCLAPARHTCPAVTIVQNVINLTQLRPLAHACHSGSSSYQRVDAPPRLSPVPVTVYIQYMQYAALERSSLFTLASNETRESPTRT